MADPNAEPSEDTALPDTPEDFRGRTWVDWEQAFSYYASLPPRRRSYKAVAAEFDVSVRTVETHGRMDCWKARLREIQRETATRNREIIISGRELEVRRIQRLIDASLSEFGERLREGMPMRLGDLERLNRLSRALFDESSQTSEAHEAQSATPERTPEHVAAVLDALAESGALRMLGLAPIPRDESRHDAVGPSNQHRRT
jgi:hypothetical protein